MFIFGALQRRLRQPGMELAKLSPNAAFSHVSAAFP
jgi:hypothetical protein